MTPMIFCDKCGAANPPHSSYCWACSQALAASLTQQPVVGAVILKQRYRILERLGEGGFGTVYKAEDIQFTHRLLAVKKLDLDTIPPRDHQDAINGFKQEANLLASLKHVHLPHIYEHFVENHDYYLVMDFIEGETLSKYVQRHTPSILPALEVVRIGIQLTSVLHYLHTRQPAIIFRDLKPENIMILPSSEIYLIDFGIARHFKPGQSGDTIRWGTREYAAPEQLAGQQTSTLSDIYSLGVVMHQLLSGDDPIPYQFAPLKLLGPDKANLANLVARMLERSKQMRPASMAEVGKELESIAQALQQRAASAKQSPQTRNRKAVQGVKPAPPGPLPTLQVPSARARGDLLYKYSHHTAAIYALSWSPNSAVLTSAGEDQQIQILQAFTGKTIFSCRKQTRVVRALAWSPDSQQLASASNDHTVQIWQADTGTQLTTYQEHTHWVHALSWSPDGRLLVSGDADNHIHVWDPRSGQKNLLYQGHDGSVLALACSPDSTLIASSDGNGVIQVWEIASGILRATYKGHQKAVSSLAWSPDGKQVVSGSWDSTLQIWDTSSGRHIATYTTHQRMVNTVVWSPANGLIASAGKDTSVQIWDPHTSQTLFTYRGHSRSVNALAWSPDGTYLASAGDDAAVHVWRAI